MYWPLVVIFALLVVTVSALILHYLVWSALERDESPEAADRPELEIRLARRDWLARLHITDLSRSR